MIQCILIRKLNQMGFSPDHYNIIFSDPVPPCESLMQYHGNENLITNRKHTERSDYWHGDKNTPNKTIFLPVCLAESTATILLGCPGPFPPPSVCHPAGKPTRLGSQLCCRTWPSHRSSEVAWKYGSKKREKVDLSYLSNFASDSDNSVRENEILANSRICFICVSISGRLLPNKRAR